MFHSFCTRRDHSILRLVHLRHRRSSSLPVRQLLLSAFLWFQKACLPPSEDPMASSYKMKGIFKGFKIISQIFAGKEQEMQIGCPTDVKHVAHIGWSTSAGTLTGNAPPSWMNDIGRSSDFSSLVNLPPSTGASWTSQDFETRDASPLGVASGVILQDTAAAAPPRPPQKKRRRSSRTTATSSVARDSSASSDDTRGTGDMVMQ